MRFKSDKQRKAVLAKLSRKPLFVATAHWKNGTTHMVVQQMKRRPKYRVIDVCEEEVTRPAEIVNQKFDTMPEAKNFARWYVKYLERKK